MAEIETPSGGATLDLGSYTGHRRRPNRLLLVLAARLIACGMFAALTILDPLELGVCTRSWSGPPRGDCSRHGAIGRIQSAELATQGNALEDKGKFEEAIATYNRALAIRPNFAMAYNDRAIAFAAMRQTDQALKDYDRAVALDPRYVHALSNRGQLYWALGRVSDATADFRRVLQIEPNNSDALVALKRLGPA